MDRTKRLEALEAEYQLFVNQRDNTPRASPALPPGAWSRQGKAPC